MALLAASATSGGGLAAFALSKFCKKKQTNQTKRGQNEIKRETNGNRIGS
jgi:membrane protein YqaA with SNARE-associated domain